MVKPNRRGWLDKISKWILDVFPGETSLQQEAPVIPAIKQPKSEPPAPSTPPPRARPKTPAAIPDHKQTQERPRSEKEPKAEPQPPSSAPAQAPPSEKTLIKAWKVFELAWKDAGLSNQYFLEPDELISSLSVLDKTFEDELIEWLFQLCTKPEALTNLAAIIERGQVRPTDNVDAIRAFAYVSVAVISRPIPHAPRQPEPFQISKQQSTPDLDPKPNQPNNDDQIKDSGSPQPTSQSAKPLASNSHQEPSVHPKQSDTTTEDGIPNQAIEELGLTTRAYNSLKRNGIHMLLDIAGKTENDLLDLRNFGVGSVTEVRNTLERLGLGVPFAASDIADQQRRAVADNRNETQTGPVRIGEAWDRLKQNVIDQYGLLTLNEEQLKELCQNTPDNLASVHLNEFLIRLHAVIGFLTDNLIPAEKSTLSELQLSISALKEMLFGRLLSDSFQQAQEQVNHLSRSLTEANIQHWRVYLQRCTGKTLSSIADDSEPPLSRERVRLMVSKITKAVGINPLDLCSAIKEYQTGREDAAELQAIQEWMTHLLRLPIASDGRPSGLTKASLWDQVAVMNLKERINLFAKHKIAPTSQEYDYHYTCVTSRTRPVGTGYWLNFENLKQFVIRHATVMGYPNVMPNQTSFPDSVRAVVTKYGGQSKVAKKIGLEYHNQLVGENGGRTYWTEEKLAQLLLDVNNQLGLPEDLMPSHSQVFEFFATSQDPIYQGKKPHSAIAALTKMGKFHWSEVAKRFNKRFISGESQKAVTISYIKAFVRDLGEHLESLTPSELFVLFQAQGINPREREKFSRTFDALVDAVQSGMVDKDQLRSWADNNEVDTINDLLEFGAELKEEATLEKREQLLLERRSKKLNSEFPDNEATAELSVEDLPTLEPKAVLKALDKAAELVESSSSDGDKVEFLKAKATAKLWDACFRDESTLISKLRALNTVSDSYSYEVQQAFLEEYEGAKSLEIPASYAFRDLKGIPREPKLMQRLVAYRLDRDMRLLNLSGTGTGKTLSAVFASQVCGSQRILISCPNGVIDSWRRCFESAYPSAILHVKPDSWSLDELDDGVNVFIVNHERFQDRFAQQLHEFCVGFRANLVVIDEIHKSKRRSTEMSSQRRKLMNEFIRISMNINPDLRVLGMSATPVINNLYEGRSLIELICQEHFDDVSEEVNLNSCMNLYQHFVVRGIRMNPGKLPRTEIRLNEVDATPLLPQIVRATKRGSFHDIEQLLVPTKIKSLSAMLKHGSKTVIFITYIKQTLEPLCSWLSSNKFSFSVFTGDEKEAQDEGYRDSLDEFIRGDSEVLVATIQCAGTGIDGLQSVCNRAVFFQLPWTSTDFEQAVGRLDRDGTNFDSIIIHIPITDISLPDGQRWSWCRSKLDRIESKRDIAKAAVDGEIPDAATLITPSEASKYWLKWLEKLDQSGSDDTSRDS